MALTLKIPRGSFSSVHEHSVLRKIDFAVALVQYSKGVFEYC